QYAVNMIVLMLCYSGHQATAPFFMPFEISIVILNENFRLTVNILTYTRNTDASFIEWPLLPFLLPHNWVNKFLSKPLQLRFLISESAGIHNKQTDGFSYLWSSKPHTISIVHGFIHIIYQRIQKRIIRINLFGFFL